MSKLRYVCVEYDLKGNPGTSSAFTDSLLDAVKIMIKGSWAELWTAKRKRGSVDERNENPFERDKLKASNPWFSPYVYDWSNSEAYGYNVDED